MSDPHLSEFLRMAGSSLRFNFFLFLRLPAAYFSGVCLREITAGRAVATVPFKWLTQNPFRSTYFASQAMAAELSTGILAMAHLHGRNPPVSMLVVHIEADFHKKATARTAFTCNDGDGMRSAVEKAARTGEPVIFVARSEGRSPSGELVSEFRVTWSFKPKARKSANG